VINQLLIKTKSVVMFTVFCVKVLLSGYRISSTGKCWVGF